MLPFSPTDQWFSLIFPLRPNVGVRKKCQAHINTNKNSISHRKWFLFFYFFVMKAPSPFQNFLGPLVGLKAHDENSCHRTHKESLRTMHKLCSTLRIPIFFYKNHTYHKYLFVGSFFNLEKCCLGSSLIRLLYLISHLIHLTKSWVVEGLWWKNRQSQCTAALCLQQHAATL